MHQVNDLLDFEVETCSDSELAKRFSETPTGFDLAKGFADHQLELDKLLAENSENGAASKSKKFKHKNHKRKHKNRHKNLHQNRNQKA